MQHRESREVRGHTCSRRMGMLDVARRPVETMNDLTVVAGLGVQVRELVRPFKAELRVVRVVLRLLLRWRLRG